MRGRNLAGEVQLREMRSPVLLGRKRSRLRRGGKRAGAVQNDRNSREVRSVSGEDAVRKTKLGC